LANLSASKLKTLVLVLPLPKVQVVI
jgi:hypothetical protein